MAYLIQKHVSKPETASVIFEKQDTSKNKFFTNAISKLFRHLRLSNETNNSNILGRHNSSIGNEILIVFNKHQSIDNKKYLNGNCLKSLLTDRFCTIESQFVNIRSINSISNFIYLSKKHLHAKIEKYAHMS
jgi:hypothetical protein